MRILSISFGASALVIGLGSLIACGGGGGGSSPSSANGSESTPTVAQKTQTAGMVKNVTALMAYTPSSMGVGQAIVVGDQTIACPTFVPALALATGCPAITPSPDKKAITLDFSGCSDMSGSITVKADPTASGSNFNYSSKTTYDHFTYHNGSDSGSINGTISTKGTVTPHSDTTSSFAFDIQGDGVTASSTIGDVTDSWTGTLNLHLTGTNSGEASTQMQAWGTAQYQGSDATYDATISSSTPIAWDTSQCSAPISGTMNWACGGTQLSAVFGQPACGSYTLNGEPFTLDNGNASTTDAPDITPQPQSGGTVEALSAVAIRSSTLGARFPTGWAMCNGGGTVWQYPSKYTVRTSLIKKWGDRAWVRAIVKDTSGETNNYYAELPGWGRNGTNGYMNVKFLSPGYPIVTLAQYRSFISEAKAAPERIKSYNFVCRTPQEANALKNKLNEMYVAKATESEYTFIDFLGQLCGHLKVEIIFKDIPHTTPLLAALTMYDVFSEFTVPLGGGDWHSYGCNVGYIYK